MQRHRLKNRLLGTPLARARRSTWHAPGRSGAWPRINPRCKPSTCSRLPGQQLQLTMRLSARRRSRCRSPSTIRRASRSTCRAPRWRCRRGASTCTRPVSTASSPREAKGRTRLVLNLDKLVPYDTGRRQQHHRDAGRQPATWPRLPARRAARPQPRAPAAGSGARELRSIDFRRGADGTGRVIVKLSDPHTPINLRQEGSQIVVDFAGAGVPKNLVRRYDVTDFATPVHLVRRRACRRRRAHRHHRRRRLRAARLPVR